MARLMADRCRAGAAAIKPRPAGRGFFPVGNAAGFRAVNVNRPPARAGTGARWMSTGLLMRAGARMPRYVLWTDSSRMVW